MKFLLQQIEYRPNAMESMVGVALLRWFILI